MSSAKQTNRLYEAMFLVDSNKANQNWDGVSETIHDIITRHGGEIANSELWDNERKLAYPIGNYTKATYVLIHFNAAPGKIEEIRNEYELSDLVIRVMILVDEDGISSEIKSLPDEPTDPVRSRTKTRDLSLPTASDSRPPRGVIRAKVDDDNDEDDSDEEVSDDKKSDGGDSDDSGDSADGDGSNDGDEKTEE